MYLMSEITGLSVCGFRCVIFAAVLFAAGFLMPASAQEALDDAPAPAAATDTGLASPEGTATGTRRSIYAPVQPGGEPSFPETSEGGITESSATEGEDELIVAGESPVVPPWLRTLPKAEPGRIEYLKGAFPVHPVVAMAVIELDTNGSRGIVFLTTGSMEVYSFREGPSLVREWTGEFVDNYARRGLAAEVVSGFHRGEKLIFVSINRFDKSFAYRWKDGNLGKAGRANGDFVDILPLQSVNLISEYGNGIISYSGPETRFVDTSGKEPTRINFPLTEDYYDGCIMQWMDVSIQLTRIAVVTEHGAIKVYQGPGQLRARTPSAYGGQLECGPSSKSGGFLFTTTVSAVDDAVVVLQLYDEQIVEKWRTPQLGGAVKLIKKCDLDGDGETELLGILQAGDGREMLFRLLPEYGGEISAQEEAPE